MMKCFLRCSGPFLLFFVPILLSSANPPSFSCDSPELLQASAMTDSTVQLTWTNTGNAYELEIRQTGQALSGVPTHSVAFNPPYIVTGLEPGMVYRFSVRTVCSPGVYSNWSTPRSFSTELNNDRPCPLTLDLRDTSCSAGGQVFRLHVDRAPGLSLGNDVKLGGIRIMIEHPWRSDIKCWLESPDGTRVQFLGGLNAGDKNIGDPAGQVCAQPVLLTQDAGALPLSAASEHDNFTGSYLPFQSILPFENGQNPNGVWKLTICDAKANDVGRLRVFGLDFRSAVCLAPDSIRIHDVQSDAADVAWNQISDSLLIEYGPAGFIPGFGAEPGQGGTVVPLSSTAGSDIHLSGLHPLQWYEVYLRRYCETGQWGSNSRPVRFFTDCTPTLLEKFDSMAICPNGCADPCPISGLWQNVPGDDYEWKVRTGPGLTYPTAGPSSAADGAGNYLYFRNSCSPTGANGKKVILRSLCVQVAAPAGLPCHFSFDLYMNTKTGQMGSLSLQASTDGGQHWSTLQTWSGSQGKRWIREYVSLGTLDGQVVVFQFIATGVFGAYGDIAIDNLAFYGSTQAVGSDHVYYRDADGDGYGNNNQRIFSCNPVAPVGYVPISGDCNDGDPSVYPGAVEIKCNQIDENCNGMADDGLIPAPAVPAHPAYCAGEDVVLTISGTATGQYYWFDALNPLVPVATGNTLHLFQVIQSGDYVVMDSLSGPAGNCVSQRTVTHVEVLPRPRLSVQTNLDFCFGTAIDLSTISVYDSSQTNPALSWYSSWPPSSGGLLGTGVLVPVNGNYTVVATTDAGCTSTATVHFSVHPRPQVHILQGDSIEICRSKPYLLTALGSGGMVPYGYTWNTGLNLSNLPVPEEGQPGILHAYTVTLTDANGCTAVSTSRLRTLNNLTQTAITALQDPSVCGGADGSVGLKPLDGAGPYQYSWLGPTVGLLNSPPGEVLLTGLMQGGYRITVTDLASGCSMVMPFLVLNAPGLTVSLDTVVQPACPGASTGRIELQVTGTHPGYQWSNGLKTQDVQALSPGNYSVTITDGACVQVLSNLEISGPPPIQIVQNMVQSEPCYGGKSGALDLEVFGASPPYHFMWSNGAGTEDLDNLPAGNYAATITDGHGCLFFTPLYSIFQPPLLQVAIQEVQKIDCNGVPDGHLHADIQGGTGGYILNWSNGGVGSDLSGLAAGVYFVTVTDSHGCTGSAGRVLDQPSALAVDKLLRINPTCAGALNGRLEAVIHGGTKPYHYKWNTGLPADTLTFLENRDAGVYAVVVTDAAGCSLESGPLTLAAPQLLTLATDSLVDADCYGSMTGKIQVSATGTVGAVQYVWNGIPGNPILAPLKAGTYHLEVTDSRNCSIEADFNISQPQAPLTVVLESVSDAWCAGEPNGAIDIGIKGGTIPYSVEWSTGQHAEDLTAVGAGNYSVLILDARGCSALLPSIHVGEPPLIQVKPTIQDIPCFGSTTGSISLEVHGGAPPFTYNWTTAGASPDQVNLSKGTYGVTVQDHTGCAVVLDSLTIRDKGESFNLAVTENEPVSCPGAMDGQIGVAVQHGTGPYQFLWSPPIGLHGGLLQSSDMATGLNGGAYQVTVVDAAGCHAVSPQIVVEESPELLLSVGLHHDVACFGANEGAIGVNLTGGLPPYAFHWSNGDESSTAEDLTAGSYSLTVTDLRGCSVKLPPLVISQPAAALGSTYDSTWLSDAAHHTWSIELKAGGGTPPYEIQWGGDSGYQQGDFATGLPVGTYVATVTDANGCTAILGPFYAGILSAADASEREVVQAAPNPCTGQTWLIPASDVEMVWIWDVQGRRTGLLQGTHDAALRIDLADRPAGVYLLLVQLRSGRLLRIPVVKGGR
jgi:subtilisin-like proprotein convertase family protein